MPGKHGRTTTTETSDYVAMMKRVFIAYGRRIGEDPVALAHLDDLRDAFNDAVNHGIWLANQASSNGQPGYSQNEMSRILGVSRQAVAKRVSAGLEVHLRLEQLSGSGALVRIADVRADRAASLAAAELEDRTGSERERLAATGTDNVRPLRR